MKISLTELCVGIAAVLAVGCSPPPTNAPADKDAKPAEVTVDDALGAILLGC